jgi:F0F1-type ATP synthase assembly protein I
MPLQILLRAFVSLLAQPVCLVREASAVMLPEEQPDVKESAVGKTQRGAGQATLALELPFVLIGTIAVGVALGYFLDRWLHTKPILMFVFGGLGFVGGIREIIRRVPG